MLTAAPIEIKFFDGTTHDNNGDGSTDDALLPDTADMNNMDVCRDEAFDLEATAVGSNPAITAFDITLDGNPVSPTGGLTNVPNPTNNQLRDTTVVITLPATDLAQNGKILKVCAGGSTVCNEFRINIVGKKLVT